MREFNEADRTKKKKRIRIRENPAALYPKVISQLEDRVRTSLKDGYLPCAVAFSIAKETGVPRVAIGEIADRLGVRITDCQLGCFRVDKTVSDSSVSRNIDDEIVSMLRNLKADGELTCTGLFDLARQLKFKPRAIAEVANIQGFKVHNCQLGCF